FERFDYLAHIFFKNLYNAFHLPATLFVNPEWVGEVMQGNQRSNAALHHTACHHAVVIERIFIPAVRLRLNAAPFHREAVRILMRFGSAVHIFLPASTPPVASQPGLILQSAL